MFLVNGGKALLMKIYVDVDNQKIDVIYDNIVDSSKTDFIAAQGMRSFIDRDNNCVATAVAINFGDPDNYFNMGIIVSDYDGNIKWMKGYHADNIDDCQAAHPYSFTLDPNGGYVIGGMALYDVRAQGRVLKVKIFFNKKIYKGNTWRRWRRNCI